MNKSILNTVVQDFINNNLDADVTKLLLQNPEFKNVSAKEIVEQIESKRKCQKKLPSWFSTDNICYPNKLNIEQASSEVTAKYKSELVSGHTLIDITGGFGVDAYYFSKKLNEIRHIEVSKGLSDMVKHNYKQLKALNISCYNEDGLSHLNEAKTTFNWIYIDPSRRHDKKGKVFFLKDCLPDVPKQLDTLFNYAPQIMIKTSPLLDISAGKAELHSVKNIHTVAVNGEVKELLWILEKNYSGKTTMTTVNLKTDKTEWFSFDLDEEPIAIPTYSSPLAYLYEPNAAILKSGAFKLISRRFLVNKLHINTHLYTSEHLIDFPGRVFKINKVLPYNKKLLKKEFLYNKANISIRNFPETVDQLKKKFNFMDGGSVYLFFTQDQTNKKVVLVCSKS